VPQTRREAGKENPGRVSPTGVSFCHGTYAEIGVRQSSEPEVPDTSWVQMILRQVKYTSSRWVKWDSDGSWQLGMRDCTSTMMASSSSMVKYCSWVPVAEVRYHSRRHLFSRSPAVRALNSSREDASETLVDISGLLPRSPVG